LSLIYPAGLVGCGGVARNHRQLINVVFWMLRTDAPWQDWPPIYGDWEAPLEQLIDELDYGLMIDYIKVHQHAAGAAGGN
jgi:transposase